jgi:hypothetical protein
MHSAIDNRSRQFSCQWTLVTECNEHDKTDQACMGPSRSAHKGTGIMRSTLLTVTG